VKTINITPKTGKLIAIKSVSDSDDLMIITKSGILIRLPVSGLRVMGRATQGVRLINIRENDAIAAVAKVEVDEDEENIEVQEGEEGVVDAAENKYDNAENNGETETENTEE
jgi:DNA gyrase subunit A